MQTNITAKVYAVYPSTSQFVQIGNGIAHYAGVQMPGVQNFERVGVAMTQCESATARG
jgi:hypothetical protein